MTLHFKFFSKWSTLTQTPFGVAIAHCMRELPRSKHLIEFKIAIYFAVENFDKSGDKGGSHSTIINFSKSASGSFRELNNEFKT